MKLQSRHTLLLTRHVFPDSLIGNGEGGGFPSCRVYIKKGAGA